MFTKRFFIPGLLMLALGISPSAARADATSEFLTGAARARGTLSDAGGVTPLVATNVPIGRGTGTDTPLGGSFVVVGNSTAYAGRGVLDPVAEPASLFLLGAGLTIAAAALKRRRPKGAAVPDVSTDASIGHGEEELA